MATTCYHQQLNPGTSNTTGNRRELKVFLGDLMMVMTPSRRHHTPTFDQIQITLEDEETNVPSGTWSTITYKGKEYGSIYRSSDNVIQVQKFPPYPNSLW